MQHEEDVVSGNELNKVSQLHRTSTNSMCAYYYK
jgi:hypothetical protein